VTPRGMPPSTPQTDAVGRCWDEGLAAGWTYGINYVAQTVD